MAKSNLWTPEFLGMSLSSFFQYMTHYALIAALPIFVIDFLQGNDWEAGLAMTFFQIGAVLCRPLAGKWIDQFNRRKMALGALGSFLAISCLYLAVHNLVSLLAVRLLHGAIFAIGTTTVAAMAALALPAERKGEGIGYFAMFSSLAMVVGPFFSLLLSSRYPFPVLFAGCVVLALLSLWCGTRQNPGVFDGKTSEKQSAPLTWNSFIEPKALPMALSGGLLFFAYSGVLVFIPLYAKQLGLSGFTSAFFAVFALVIVLTRPLVGRLFDQAGAKMVIYSGLLLFGTGLIALSQVQGLYGFLAAAVLIGGGFGAVSPAFQTLAIQHSPVRRAGVATATYFLALDISVGLGSFFLSAVAAQAGYPVMYLMAAFMIGMTAAVFYRIEAGEAVIRPQ